MQAFLELMGVLILIAAGLTFIAGSLNALFGWDLALKIGGSTIPLPDDFTGVVAGAVILLLLGGLCFLLANLQRSFAFLRRRRRSAFALVVVTVAVLVIGLSQLFPDLSLELAVQEGNSAAAQAMLQERQYPPSVLSDLTYWSLQNQDYVLTQMLFDQGADIHHRRGEFNSTLLHDAATFFDPSATDFLLEKGIDVNAQDSRGRTALHLLITYRGSGAEKLDQSQLLAMVKGLVAAGADSNLADQAGETPLTLAKAKGYDAMIQVLQQP